MATTMVQKQDALVQANATKGARVQARARVRQSGRLGGLIVADLIADPPPWLATTYVWQLVQWVPWVRDVRAAAMLRAAKVDPWRRVGRMTPKMRVALAEQMRHHASGVEVRPVRPAVGLVCSGCGDPMRARSTSGRCGFCEAERAEIRGRS